MAWVVGKGVMLGLSLRPEGDHTFTLRLSTPTFFLSGTLELIPIPVPFLNPSASVLPLSLPSLSGTSD